MKYLALVLALALGTACTASHYSARTHHRVYQSSGGSDFPSSASDDTNSASSAVTDNEVVLQDIQRMNDANAAAASQAAQDAANTQMIENNANSGPQN